MCFRHGSNCLGYVENTDSHSYKAHSYEEDRNKQEGGEKKKMWKEQNKRDWEYWIGSCKVLGYNYK